MNYEDFLKQKDYVLESSGFSIDKDKLNPMLFDFQKDVVRWALAKGRACIFASCGLGKTLMQASSTFTYRRQSFDSCTSIGCRSNKERI